jgi:vitamin B12 transporter
MNKTYAYLSRYAYLLLLPLLLATPCELKSFTNETAIVMPTVLKSFTNETAIVAPADTIRLPDVVVSASRFDLRDDEFPSVVRRIGALDLSPKTNATVGNLLNSYAGATLRSYGSGAVQTVALQGFSSSQLLVLWNGIPLNHPMLGLTDLSLYPALLIDELVLNSSQGSAESGGTALGGVVMLNQYPSNESYQQVKFESGSYGLRGYNALISTSVQNLRLNVGYTHHAATNDFEYRDITMNPPVTKNRTNASRSLHSLVLNSRLTYNNTVHSSGIWLTDVVAKTPGPIITPTASANQNDQIARVSHKFDSVVNSKFVHSGNAYFSAHQLDYIDPNADIESLSQTQTFGMQTEGRYTPKPELQLRAGVGTDIAWLNSTEYEAPHTEHFFVFMSNYWRPVERIGVLSTTRYDVYNRFKNAISTSLGINSILYKDRLRAYVNVSRNYAPPTFNDLYWPGLGNPDLVPETSFKIEAGTVFSSEYMQFDVNAFRNQIGNGIQWLPREGSSFRPYNVKSVLSRGVSINGDADVNVGAVAANFHIGYAFIRSIYAESRFTGDQAVGLQVVYQPEHRTVTRLSLKYRDMAIYTAHQFTSERFATEDHSFSLDPFQTIDIGLRHHIAIKRYAIETSISAENITNTEYSQIRWYPMPVRTWHFSISIKHQ